MYIPEFWCGFSLGGVAGIPYGGKAETAVNKHISEKINCFKSV